MWLVLKCTLGKYRCLLCYHLGLRLHVHGWEGCAVTPIAQCHQGCEVWYAFAEKRGSQAQCCTHRLLGTEPQWALTALHPQLCSELSGCLGSDASENTTGWLAGLKSGHSHSTLEIKPALIQKQFQQKSWQRETMHLIVYFLLEFQCLLYTKAVILFFRQVKP